jgi:hypothetical protein
MSELKTYLAEDKDFDLERGSLKSLSVRKAIGLSSSMQYDDYL